MKRIGRQTRSRGMMIKKKKKKTEEACSGNIVVLGGGVEALGDAKVGSSHGGGGRFVV